MAAESPAPLLPFVVIVAPPSTPPPTRTHKNDPVLRNTQESTLLLPALPMTNLIVFHPEWGNRDAISVVIVVIGVVVFVPSSLSPFTPLLML
jgi:hypothetical protein